MEGNLNEFLVGQLPTVIYTPHFITQTEETHLLQKVAIHSSVISNFFRFWFRLFFFTGFALCWLCRFMKPLYQSGNLWRTEDFRIGVCWNFFLFFHSPSLNSPPPCKLHTEAVVEEKVHRVSPIDSIPPLLPLVFGIDRWCRPRKRTSTPRL
jgi:hypothetical protein